MSDTCAMSVALLEEELLHTYVCHVGSLVGRGVVTQTCVSCPWPCRNRRCGALSVHLVALAHVPQATHTKYERMLLRSFLELNQDVKWCPNPKGCDRAVK